MPIDVPFYFFQIKNDKFIFAIGAKFNIQSSGFSMTLSFDLTVKFAVFFAKFSNCLFFLFFW